jgi:hypothetical protein
MPIALVVGYVCVMLFAHNTFVNISVSIMNSLSLPVYNYVVKVVGLTTGFILISLLLLSLARNRKDSGRKIFYLTATSIFIVVHASFMFEMNIEIIHSFEYSILALLLFTIFGRMGTAIVFSLPIMMLDEWYQYKILYPTYVEYYELNDILMDIFGAAFALITFWILGAIQPKPAKKFLYRIEVKLIAGLLFLIAIAFAAGLFATHQSTSSSQTIFVFSRLTSPDLFWRVHAFTKATYHVLTPLEGVLAIACTCFFYLGIDKTEE